MIKKELELLFENEIKKVNFPSDFNNLKKEILNNFNQLKLRKYEIIYENNYNINEILSENEYQKFVKENIFIIKIIEKIDETNSDGISTEEENNNNNNHLIQFISSSEELNSSFYNVENKSESLKENDNLKQKIKELEKKNKQLENENISLKTKINEYKILIQKLKSMNDNNEEKMSNDLQSFLEKEFSDFQTHLMNNTISFFKTMINNQKSEFNLYLNQEEIFNTLLCNLCENKSSKILYKCEKCEKFYLCEECYKKGLENHNHKSFKQIYYNNQIKNNEEKDYQNNNEKLDNTEYSYCLENNDKIEKNIYSKTIKIGINLRIKNNGDNDFKGNVRLQCNKKSNIKCNPINLQPLKKNESQNCIIEFEGLNQFKIGVYYCYLNLIIGNKIIGKEITIQLNIINDVITRFRQNYKLDKEVYSNKTIWEKLVKHNFNFQESFDSL